jgi:hypothetical protein
VPSFWELGVPVTSYLVDELRGVVERFSNVQDGGTEKVRLDRRDVADFLNLADRIRAEANAYLKGPVGFDPNSRS